MTLQERVELLRQEVADITKVLEASGYEIISRTGEVRAHPLVRERHAALALLYRLEAKLPDEVEDFDF